MTAALHSVLHDFAIPYLKVRRITALAFVDNIGSHRVFIKNGFTQVGTAPLGPHGLPSAARRKRQETTQAVFQWRLKE